MPLKLYLFGPPRVMRNDEPLAINLRKALALFAYLAVTRQAHSRDALATLLWPEKDQQAARANLRRTLYDLGQLLAEPLLEVEAETVALDTSAGLWLDSQHFEAILAANLSTPLQQDVEIDGERVRQLVAAADLYSADFMAGFNLPDSPEFDDWQFFQREGLRRSFTTLLEQLVAAYVAAAQWEDALRYARRWLALDPLEEAVQRHLMQLYAQAGQPAAAVRQYEECVRILAQELDAPPADETTALYEAIRTRRFPPPENAPLKAKANAVVARPHSADGALVAHHVTPPHNLPTQTTPFVGRNEELDELLRRLAEPACRLLTIVGPGGIGKTRLALQAAQRIVDLGLQIEGSGATSQANHQSAIVDHQFPDGVFFVPLQPVNSASGVVPAIAIALGFHFYSGVAPQEQLLRFLQGKQMLLVLDNFEHLLASAELIVEILAAAPDVKLILTSREPLQLAEEWFHPLAGMRLPPATLIESAGQASRPAELVDSISAYDAVQLFIQTARRTVVDFAPAKEQPQIVRICRLVDGMPLGIVLAASWLRTLSCAQIAHEIERGIDILVARHQNVPERHRNMRVVLEQSWQMFDDKAQEVLKRLSVFRGGFLQEAAKVVASASLLTLADLVDKAWVYRTADGRYQMHELLRQFAAERLAEAKHVESTTLDAHARFYLQRIADSEAALIGAQQLVALDEIDAEFDNIQAAWVRAAEQRNANLIEASLQGLYMVFFLRSRYAEGEETFSYALTQLDDPAEDDTEPKTAQVCLRLRARIGACCTHQGDLDSADAYFAAVLGQSTAEGELAFVHALSGTCSRWRGNRAAAEASLSKSLALARNRGDQNQMAEALLGLSEISASFGKYAEGEHFAREALALCRQFQRPDLTAFVLAALAWATNCQGRYAESEQHYRDSLAIFESIEHPFGIALTIQFLGWVAYCEGGEHLPAALAHFERAIKIYRQIGHGNNLAMALADYALAANELGQYTAAFDCAQEALPITESFNLRTLMPYALNGLGAAACGLGDLAASRRYLLRSLRVANEAQIADQAAVTLYCLAQLLLKESQHAKQTDSTRLQTQALALLAWVIHQQATWQPIRDRAQRALDEMVTKLASDLVTAARTRGEQWTLDEVAEAMHNEL